MTPDVVQLAMAALPTAGGLLAVVAAFVTLDAVLPVLPSETAVVTIGVLAATDVVPAQAALVVVAAAALLGDLLSYSVGSTFARHWTRLRASATRRGAALRAADAALARDGAALVASARFVPGGRTAVTLSAGAAGLSRRRFVLSAAVGSTAWAAVFVGLGYLGGRVFADNPLLGLAVGLGVVLVASAGTEVARRVRASRRPEGPERTDLPVTAVTR